MLQVRQAGQEVVLILYKVDQEAVRAEMPEDNYRTRSVLFLSVSHSQYGLSSLLCQEEPRYEICLRADGRLRQETREETPAIVSRN